jgi:small subunit ribosomal protein S16
MVVQDSRFNPKSGRVVAYLGSYDPHTKAATIDSEKTSKYLENGAQPSDRAVRILQAQGIKLPGWVKTAQPKNRSVRHPEKRRSTAPKEETPVEPEATSETPAEVEEATAEATEASAEPEKSSEKSA